ncbi:MAG TPA: class I SAM-dependent methyltransferase [Chthoniobacterales bacterium]|jgi:SAM-dependent methyltransferase
MSEESKKTLEAWQASSQYWNKYRALIAGMFAPLTSGLIEEVRIGIGQKVLDIGGGSGEPSLTISSIVGPTGSVMYTDPAPGMVESARVEADRRGLTNIQFTQCSADQLPFANGVFDVAVSRLSSMFFSDPVSGVREALRVIVDDGPASFVVWGPEQVNPFFSIMNDVMDRFVEEPQQDPDAPDAFRFSEPGKLAGILANAGAEDVIERRLDFAIEAAISFEQFWQLRTEMSTSLRAQMARLTPNQVPAVKQAVADGVGRFFADAKMNFPAQALIVTGRNVASAARR